MKKSSLSKRDKNKGWRKEERSFSSAGESAVKANGMLFYCMMFVALTLPNLIYSGLYWYEGLHITKWFFTMMPVAIISVATGILLALYGAKRNGLKSDTFGLLWLLLLIYASAQPLWVNITSWSSYMKAWFFLASLFAVYIYSFSMFESKKWHRAVLWFANINAAINVLFSELLMRNMAGSFPFIMNVPGNYTGNTGQQEMFGLWMAMALLNGIYLHIETSSSENKNFSAAYRWGNLFLVAVNAWGLWNSTTRGGIVGLSLAVFILAACAFSARDYTRLKKMGVGAVIVLVMLIVVVMFGKLADIGRSDTLVSKMKDMTTNVSSFGKRTEIWKTSLAMIKEHTIGGVGLGHYKWHYLEAQRAAIKKNPDMKWQYTYWAHSEYLQWLAEFGVLGTLLLVGAALWWLWSFTKALIQRKTLSPEAVWASAMIFLICFDAVFSRPFHRIENVIWLAFAFALANRELLANRAAPLIEKYSSLGRAFGAASFVIGAAAILYLTSGMIGDRSLRIALETNSAAVCAKMLDRALSIPMTRDNAQLEKVYLLKFIAETSKSPEDWHNTLAQLVKAHRIQPKGKTLVSVLEMAEQLGDKKTFLEFIPYLQPEKY